MNNSLQCHGSAHYAGCMVYGSNAKAALTIINTRRACAARVNVVGSDKQTSDVQWCRVWSAVYSEIQSYSDIHVHVKSMITIAVKVTLTVCVLSMESEYPCMPE